MRLISARRQKTDFEKKGERPPDKFEKKDRTQGSFLKTYTDFSFRFFEVL